MDKFSKRNMQRFLGAIAVAVAIPMTATAFQGAAGDGECSMENRRGPRGSLKGGEMPMPHLQGLKLSEAQRDKLFDIMHAQAPVMREKMKALHKAEEELRALATASDFSDAKAISLSDAATRAQADMTLLRVRTERQVFEMLTAEQRKLMLERRRQGDGHGHRDNEAREGERRQRNMPNPQ